MSRKSVHRAIIKPMCALRDRMCEHAKKYPPKHPNLKNKRHDDELVLLGWKHGRRRFPFKKKYYCGKYCKENNGDVAKFLWVAFFDRIVVIPENCRAAKRLHARVAKHTNLTGGKKACGGGEMKILSNRRCVINGCSGRYGLKDMAELDSMVEVLKKSGWLVETSGWDPETNWFCRL